MLGGVGEACLCRCCCGRRVHRRVLLVVIRLARRRRRQRRRVFASAKAVLGEKGLRRFRGRSCSLQLVSHTVMSQHRRSTHERTQGRRVCCVEESRDGGETTARRRLRLARVSARAGRDGGLFYVH